MSTLNKKPIVPPKVPSRGTSASTEAAQENAEMEVSSVVRPEEAIPRDFTVERDANSDVLDISDQLAEEAGIDLAALEREAAKSQLQLRPKAAPIRTASVYDDADLFADDGTSDPSKDHQLVAVMTIKRLFTSPVIGDFRWFEHFGPWKVNQRVRVPRYVASALIERGSVARI